MDSNRVFAPQWDEYELVDAGNERKLERWGNVYTIRPERQAYFPPGLSNQEWANKAHWEFVEDKGQQGVWKPLQKSPEQWKLGRGELTFKLELTKFKHLGLFPEQSFNWQFIENTLGSNDRFLNLFAYTGASSVVARAQGAEVIHCEAMKQLVEWAAANQAISDLEGIKWVVEDAVKFARREVKRGNKYSMIQMDPPAFGRGAKGEKWKLENQLDELLSLANDMLESGGWLILNTYSPKLPLNELKKRMAKSFGGKVELVAGLWLKTTTGKRMYTGDVIHAIKD